MALLFGKTITNEEFIQAWGEKAAGRYETEKVLPSLIICQAIQESGWGTSEISKTCWNYHGLNYYNDSVSGKYAYLSKYTQQEVNGILKDTVENFCIFNNIDEELDCLYAWYNRNKDAYKYLHGNTDALKNFELIRQAGYATDSSYTDNLIQIYNAYPVIRVYDNIVLTRKEKDIMTINRNYTTTNFCNTGSRGRAGTKDDYHWIVVHYVGNADANGFETTAQNNCIYYRDANVGSSANFYVDSTGVYQSVPWDSNRYAWHCGIGIGNENKYQYLLNDGTSQCNNATSIGVEICVCKKSVKTKNASDTDWYFNETTYNNAVEFIKYLMNYFEIDINHVVRHYDVNTIHKLCPRPFIGDDINVCYGKTGNTLWNEFKSKLSTSIVSASQSAPDTSNFCSSSSTGTTTYRVRKSWENTASQIGAFTSLANAKKLAGKNSGYYVFDENGTIVYPVITPSTVCQAYKINSSDGTLNMRSTPDSSAPDNIIKVLKNNEFVLASKERPDGWIYVKYVADKKVYEGWVFKNYLIFYKGLYGKIVNSSDGTLNIRADYNAKGPLIAVMGNGFAFTVLKQVSSTNWGLIWCGETIGYSDISDNYSKKI